MYIVSTYLTIGLVVGSVIAFRKISSKTKLGLFGILFIIFGYTFLWFPMLLTKNKRLMSY